MASLKETLLHNLAVVLIYISTGFLGLLLAVPPGYATAIWAPSGIALGATLVWGLRVLPGIFIASFILNFYVTFNNAGNVFDFLNLFIGLITGIGALLQALLGWWLVKRFVRLNSLHLPKEILLFALLTGPVSCIVAATIGNVGLCLLHLMSFDNFALSWVTWWIGDSIGVLIFTPVFMISLAKPRKLWRSRVFPILLPLCITFLIVVIAHIFYSHSELKRVQTKFAELTQLKLNELTDDLSDIAQKMSFFLTMTPTIDNEVFQNQANLLLQEHSIIQSIYWVPKVTNRDEFERKYNLKISENLLGNYNKSLYFPILFNLSRNQTIIPKGYDLSTKPAIFDSLNSPNETSIKLNNNSQLDTVFITSAVYRQAELAGYTVVQVNLIKVFNKIFDNFLYYSSLSLKLNSTGLDVKPIFEINNKKNQLGQIRLFHISYENYFANSIWDIQATLSPHYINHEYTWQVWSALTATLFFCVLMNLILFILYGQNYLVQFLVEAKTVQLNTEKAKNLLLLNAAGEGIIWIDLNYKITFINPAAEKLLGYSSDELKDESIIKILGDKDKVIVSPIGQIENLPIHDAIQKKSIIKIKEVIFLQKNQKPLWVEYTCIPIIIDNKVKGAAVIFSNITERLENEMKLIKMAHFDPLTKLPNRLSFFDYLEHSLARAQRNNTQLGVCFIDIDNFKTINDTFGHVCGDKLLIILPEMIIPHLRKIDYLARIGGDEFGLIFEETHENNDLIKIFDRILLAFEYPIQIEDQFIKTSITIGVAMYPKNGSDIQTLFKKADMAMYHGKAKGKSTFSFFDENST
ncbi:MAG: diguanylate cyclase [Tatlockia sp.]|nr:diguanylate cyclase [Tatlockia sp.]